MNPGDRCGLCRFFSAGFGECNRLPPVVVMGQGFRLQTAFPKVTPHEVCGEFKPKAGQ